MNGFLFFRLPLPTKSKQDPKVLFNVVVRDLATSIAATIEAVMMVVVMVMMMVIIPSISRHHHDRLVVIAIAGIEGVVMVVVMMVVELGELNVGVCLRRRGFIDGLQQSPCVRDRLQQLGV